MKFWEFMHIFQECIRMYNSGINVLAAIFFGWLAFLGFAVNPQFSYLKGGFVFYLIGIVTILMASYFWYRVLQHGRFVWKIEEDLRLRDYLDSHLPRFSFNKRLSERQKAESFTCGEISSLIIFLGFLLVTFVYVLLAS